MKIAIVPAGPAWENAVKEFNSRLRVGKSEFFFPEYYEPKWLPKLPGRRIYQEIYLVVDQDAHAVHGGFILKFQYYKIGTEVHKLAHLQLPLSEGLVNKAYHAMGMMIIRGAQEIEPNLYTMGMGGIHRTLPQGLKKSDWFCDLIPFYFKILRAPGFMRNIVPYRNTTMRKTALDFLAMSGLGSLGLMLFDIVKPTKKISAQITCERFEEFGAWSDATWEKSKNEYDFVAEKDAPTQNILYPPHSKFIKIRVNRDNTVLGWAVLLVTPMTKHKYFGAMTVCTLVDCFGAKADMQEIVACGLREAQKGKADVIISNQSNPVFVKIFKNLSFMSTTSNYGHCMSPEIMEILGETKTRTFELNSHLNRGDGDGPLSL